MTREEFFSTFLQRVNNDSLTISGDLISGSSTNLPFTLFGSDDIEIVLEYDGVRYNGVDNATYLLNIRRVLFRQLEAAGRERMRQRCAKLDADAEG